MVRNNADGSMWSEGRNAPNRAPFCPTWAEMVRSMLETLQGPVCGKLYTDLIGNGINHPNDCIYAQTILKALSE